MKISRKVVLSMNNELEKMERASLCLILGMFSASTWVKLKKHKNVLK
jgi:hypothetical protein